MKRILRVIKFPSSRKLQIRFNSSNDHASDKDLQILYEGIIPRLFSLQELFKPSGRDNYEELVKKGVVTSGHIAGLVVYADLQNPLLKKYKFDPSDFMTGAKYAFQILHKSMASQEFSNFASGFLKSSTTADLLRDCLSHRLYSACLEACKSITTRGMSMVMTDLIVSKSLLTGVSTKVSQIIDYNEDDDYDFDRSIIVNPIIEEDLEKYPSGSVVATIDVMFETEEMYKNKMDSDPQESIVSRKTVTVWSFQGCISGHRSLNWRVVAFDGLGQR